MSENGKRVETDYALIIKAKNPFNSDNTVIILAGSYDLGTLAVGKIFSRQHLSQLKALRNKTKRAKYFEALLRVTSVDGGLSFEIEDVSPIGVE